MSKSLEFTKMEGAGNDFVVIDNRKYGLSLDEIIELAPCLCNRRFGIGADGLLVLQDNEDPDVDFTMIYRNADGSDAGMCGNGARCICRFAHRSGLPAELSFNVHDNIYHAVVNEEDVRISFSISLKADDLTIDGSSFIRADAGTEHLVCMVPEDILEDEDQLRIKGRSVRTHAMVQPKGSNVNFVSAADENSLLLQTYERGVEDLTLACGTGSLASSIALHHHQSSEKDYAEYEVRVKGGTLFTSFSFDPDKGIYSDLTLKGPAHFVFEGIIRI